MKKLYFLRFALLLGIFALWGGDVYAQYAEDVLTSKALGFVENAQYATFNSINVGSSAAEYSGKAGDDHGAIQINDKSGVYSSVSGGLIREIVVTGYKGSKSLRQVNVYGSNKPFTSWTDYKSGTLLGSVTFELGDAGNTTTSTIPVEGDYQYVGIGANGAIYLTEIKLSWETSTTGVAAPTIASSAGESFTDKATVSITAAEGLTVYYTTDGTTPVAGTSQEYSAPFDITATTTVKAIAVDAEGNASPVASATFTKTEPIVALEGLSALAAQIRADNVTSTSEAKTYTVNLSGAIVTGVLGSQVYLEDGEAGILYYNKGNAYEAGTSLSGTATVKGLMYNGAPELTAIEGDLQAATATIPVTTLTLEQLLAETDKYTGRRVKVDKVTAETGFENRNATVSQDGKTLTVYAQNSSLTLDAGSMADIVGYPGYYKTVPQLNVIAQEDIIVEGALQQPVFAFDPVSGTAKVGDAPFALTLNSNTDGAVTYASSDETVATVTDNGTVTPLAAGTVNITATAAATATYAAATATYTLTVTDPTQPVPGYVFRKVTAADQLVAGETYLIVGTATKDGSTYALGYQKDNNRLAVPVTIANGEIAIDVATDKADQTKPSALVLGGSEGQWTFYDGLNAGYLYAASSSKNYLKVESSVDKNARATVELDAAGNAAIVFTGGNTKNKLRYNFNSDLFSCYDSGQYPVQLYRRYATSASATGTFEIKAAEGYGTLYTDQAYTMPEGVTGMTVTAVDKTEGIGTLTLNADYPAGTVVPAHTALVVKAVPGTYTYEATDAAAAENPNLAANRLKGSVAAEITTGGDLYYKLAYDDNGENLGFYWGATDGAAFTNAAGKAYLALTTAEAANVKAFSFADLVSGIAGVTTDTSAPATIYTIAGVRVNATTTDGLPKGLYIVNGKKVLVK